MQAYASVLVCVRAGGHTSNCPNTPGFVSVHAKLAFTGSTWFDTLNVCVWLCWLSFDYGYVCVVGCQKHLKVCSVVASFPGTLSYAFAYGSAVKPQKVSAVGSMIDFVFATDDPVAWHATNMKVCILGGLNQVESARHALAGAT
jgi:hypothetical protein